MLRRQSSSEARLKLCGLDISAEVAPCCSVWTVAASQFHCSNCLLRHWGLHVLLLIWNLMHNRCCYTVFLQQVRHRPQYWQRVYKAQFALSRMLCMCPRTIMASKFTDLHTDPENRSVKLQSLMWIPLALLCIQTRVFFFSRAGAQTALSPLCGKHNNSVPAY